MPRRLIVTVDDFGLSLPVNEAIERGHRNGIVTAASLMVAEPAAADAVARARANPRLGVGLHVVVVAGRPLLPPERIPDLVGTGGTFSSDLARIGVRYFFSRAAQRQLEAEIRAQFEAFRSTGLPLDHVNAQCHYHLHPTVLGLIVRIGRDYGSPPMRIPDEPFAASWRATHERLRGRFANALFLAPFVRVMKRGLRNAGIAHNDHVFGFNDTGRMTVDRVVGFLGNLPDGVTEMYFHAATRRWPGIAPDLAAYRLEEELDALLSPRAAAALRASGAEPIAFRDLADAG
ncbi:MAG TPA: hopanoid biosynthesis-associated protein HpnK [Candidatus Elarobacter sp.]